MSQIYSGRFTAKTDQPFVVFLIGMRINKWWKVRSWWPVAVAMQPMLAELYRHPELGFLGGTMALTSQGPLLVQYWRSFEDLEHFARSKDQAHLPAWRRFYQASFKDNSVGVWHETYAINPGQHESVYVNMPKFGLGKVMEHAPAVGHSAAARGRMNPAEPA